MSRTAARTRTHSRYDSAKSLGKCRCAANSQLSHAFANSMLTLVVRHLNRCSSQGASGGVILRRCRIHREPPAYTPTIERHGGIFRMPRQITMVPHPFAVVNSAGREAALVYTSTDRTSLADTA